MRDEIKKRMERRYIKYFKHWKDYEMLTCILAMIGLVLALVEYESTFDYLGRSAEEIMRNSFVRIIITITSVLAIFSLLFRYWLFTFWMDFQDPKHLKIRYRELKRQIEEENNNNNLLSTGNALKR